MIVYTVLRPPLVSALPLGADTQVVDGVGIVADPRSEMAMAGSEGTGLSRTLGYATCAITFMA